MHYRNGREAKNGDKVIQFGFGDGQAVTLGVLHSAKPGNDYCNGQLAPLNSATTGACLCDCLHLDDLEAILANVGLNKRPEGK